VAALTPHLPDAGVRLLPALGGGVDEAEQEAPVVVVGRRAPLVPLPRQLEEVPVDVELQLLSGGVADADRSRAAVALEVGKLELGQTALPAHAEHDLQVVGAAGGGSLDEAPEAVGFGFEAQLAERSHGEL